MPSLTPGEMADLISSERRRATIRAVAAREPVGKDALTDAVRRRTNAGHTDQARKRVYVSLHQTHLPRLEDAGIIRADRDGNWHTTANAAAVLAAIDHLEQLARDGPQQDTDEKDAGFVRSLLGGVANGD